MVDFDWDAAITHVNSLAPKMAAPVQIAPQVEPETSSNFTRGVKAGLLQTAAVGPALVSMAGKAVGADPVAEWGAEKATGLMESAGEYAPDTSFEELVDDPSVDGAANWIGYTFGTMLPTMLAGLTGAGIGAKVAGKLATKQLLKTHLAKQAEKQIAKGVAKDVAIKTAAKNFVANGAKAGVVGSMGPLEGAHNFMTDVEQHGIENASPGKAALTGAAAGLVELGFGGGHLRIINKIFGPKAAKIAKEAFKKGDTKFLARTVKEAIIQGGGEGLQELTQEELSILNEIWTGEDQSLFEKKNLMRAGESFAAGALMGGPTGAVTGMVPPREFDTGGDTKPVREDVPPSRTTDLGDIPAPEDAKNLPQRNPIVAEMERRIAAEKTPKPAAESAKVFESQKNPADASYNVFDEAGMTKPVDQQAREANQKVIDKTNVAAENEIEANRKAREEYSKAQSQVIGDMLANGDIDTKTASRRLSKIEEDDKAWQKENADQPAAKETSPVAEVTEKPMEVVASPKAKSEEKAEPVESGQGEVASKPLVEEVSPTKAEKVKATGKKLPESEFADRLIASGHMRSEDKGKRQYAYTIRKAFPNNRWLRTKDVYDRLWKPGKDAGGAVSSQIRGWLDAGLIDQRFDKSGDPVYAWKGTAPTKDTMSRREADVFFAENTTPRDTKPSAKTAQKGWKPNPKKEANVSTLRGRIKKEGGINFLNFKGELKNLPLSVRYLSNNKTGTPIDIAEQTLKDEGWLDKKENLLDLLTNPKVLKRGKIGDEAKTAAQKKQKTEQKWEHEPEEPPPGDYEFVKAKDLPEGEDLTIIDGNGIDGWDVFKVIEKDPFSVLLEDGRRIELSREDEVQVLKKNSKAQEPIDDKGSYVDWAKPKRVKKDGLTQEYFGTYNKDGSFKSWKTKVDINRLQENIGENILTLSQEDYGHQPIGKGPAVGKSKQTGFNFGDPKQKELFGEKLSTKTEGGILDYLKELKNRKISPVHWQKVEFDYSWWKDRKSHPQRYRFDPKTEKFEKRTGGNGSPVAWVKVGKKEHDILINDERVLDEISEPILLSTKSPFTQFTAEDKRNLGIADSDKTRPKNPTPPKSTGGMVVTAKRIAKDFKKKGFGVKLGKDTVTVSTASGNITINVADSVVEDDGASIGIRYRRKPKPGEKVAGTYFNGTIKLKRDLADSFTLGHELFHHMKAAGLFTENEEKMLARHGDEESQARWVEGMLRKRDSLKGNVAKLIQKIGDFLDALANVFVRTERGIVRDVETGLFLKRKGTPKATATEHSTIAGRWHSQMTSFLEDKLPGKGSPQQIRQMLDSWAKKGQIKEEELEWSGLREWLAEQDRKVSKQEVLDFLAANHVQVEEVEKGGQMFDDQAIEDTLDMRSPDGWREYLQEEMYLGEDEVGVSDDEIMTIVRTEVGIGNIPIYEDTPYNPNADGTKFSGYQEPGGENYRELLLTLPVKDKKQATKWSGGDRFQVGFPLDNGQIPVKDMETGRVVERLDSEREATERAEAYNSQRPEYRQDAERNDDRRAEGEQYRSSHFDEPNILAHVRFNERTDADGAKVLFLEEIQSDWHQAGRKEGYKQHRRWVSIDKHGMPSGYFDTELEAKKEAEKIGGTFEQNDQKVSGVPNAPFKKTWPMLAMKRMVRYAAENGFDKIAWTPGIVQVKRYEEATRKAVDSIHYEKDEDGFYAIDAMKNGVTVYEDERLSEKELGDLVGKHITKQIVEDSGTPPDAKYESAYRGWKKISGKDLTIGGEGMKGFYDKILPSAVNKFFGKKAWGKARVGTTEIASEKTTNSSEDKWVVYRDGEHYLTFDTEIEGQEYVDKWQGNDALEGDKLELRKTKRLVSETNDVTQEVWSLPITPEMKSKALYEGMPMFSTKTTPELSTKVEGFEYAPPETMVDRAKSVFERYLNDAMYWVVDKNRPIQTVQNQLSKVTDKINVFLKETQRPKITAARIEKAWEDEIQPLIEKMAKYGVDRQDLELYAHALHAPEANAALRKANAKLQVEKVINILNTNGAKAEANNVKDFAQGLKKPEDWLNYLGEVLEEYGRDADVALIKAKWEKFAEKPSGMTDKESAEILKQYKGDEKIEELRRMLSQINANRLDVLFDAGQLPKEEYEAIKNKYKYYVPLYREGYSDSLFGSSRGLKPSGRQIKVRGGSTRNVVDIFAHTVANYEKAINVSEKARSQRALHGLVTANLDSDLIDIEPVKKSPRHDKAGNIRMYPDLFNVGDNEMRLMVDGKQYLISVQRDNKDAMLMMKTLKAEDGMSGPIVNFLAKINRVLARINTTWSPEFIVSNFIRDIQTAGINIQDTGVKGEKMFRGAKNAIQAIWAVERGKRKGTELEKLYDRFKASGGKIGWSDVHGSVTNLSKKITKEIEMSAGKRPTRKAIKRWLDLIENANTSIENGVRLHTFKLAVEQGKTDERAAQIASDLTVDFTKKGAAGPVINSLYLFANAGIQGSYRIIRAASKSKKVQATLAGIVGTSFLVGLLNSMAGEDDDGEDYFNKIDDFVRERNMIFMIPGTKGKYVKIPAPWGYNLFWNIGSELSRAVTKEKYDALSSAGRLISVFKNAFNPIASGTLLQTLSPTVADPFAMVAENKNWFGGDLMPALDKFEKIPTPDSQRYWKSASSGSKWIAKTLNSIGGDEIKSGLIDVSPETLDLIVDTAGGSALRFFKDSFGLPMKVLRNEEIEMHKIPFARRVAGSQPAWANSRIYYENVEDVLVTKERLNAYRGTDKYQAIAKATVAERKLIPLAEKSEKELRKLRKLYKRASARGSKQVSENIKKRMDTVYNRFNRAVNKNLYN
jgi:hypothetical protein